MVTEIEAKKKWPWPFTSIGTQCDGNWLKSNWVEVVLCLVQSSMIRVILSRFKKWNNEAGFWVNKNTVFGFFQGFKIPRYFDNLIRVLCAFAYFHKLDISFVAALQILLQSRPATMSFTDHLYRQPSVYDVFFYLRFWENMIEIWAFQRNAFIYVFGLIWSKF